MGVGAPRADHGPGRLTVPGSPDRQIRTRSTPATTMGKRTYSSLLLPSASYRSVRNSL
jgi:hypothetical protein